MLKINVVGILPWDHLHSDFFFFANALDHSVDLFIVHESSSSKCWLSACPFKWKPIELKCYSMHTAQSTTIFLSFTENVRIVFGVSKSNEFNVFIARTCDSIVSRVGTIWSSQLFAWTKRKKSFWFWFKFQFSSWFWLVVKNCETMKILANIISNEMQTFFLLKIFSNRKMWMPWFESALLDSYSFISNYFHFPFLIRCSAL